MTRKTFCVTAAIARDDCGDICAPCRNLSPPRVDNRNSNVPADGSQGPGQVADPGLPGIPERLLGQSVGNSCNLAVIT